MDISSIEKLVEKIQVIPKNNEDVEVINESPLQMIGKGRQGAVFLLSDDICMKVYGLKEDCEREYYALSLGQHTDLFPKIYAKGDNYIAMELVKGVDLREYLQSQPLTEELSKKLIEMLIIFKEIGYERIDHHKRQIYLQEDGKLKVIDVGRTVWRDRVYPYPRKLLNSLGNEYKETFLSHVAKFAPELYEEWKHYIEMERLSSKVTKILLNRKEKKPKKIKKEAKKLLTTKEKPKYEKALEDIVYKVFKEEWAKVLIAQGKDPDELKDRLKDLLGEEYGKKKIEYMKNKPAIESTKLRYNKKGKKKKK